MIAQGSKEVWLGDDCYRYDADRWLITAAALPTATRVTEASVERPYLGVVLGLDPALLGSVMVEPAHPASGDRAAVRAFEVSPLEAGLLDALVRLVGLLDAPAEEARFLRPLVTREIVFRLLKGEQDGSSVRSRSSAVTATASQGPWSGSARTSTGRFGSKTSPGSSG